MLALSRYYTLSGQAVKAQLSRESSVIGEDSRCLQQALQHGLQGCSRARREVDQIKGLGKDGYR